MNANLSENEKTFRLVDTADIDSIVEICRAAFPKVVRWQGARFVAKKWCKVWLHSLSNETWVCVSGRVILGFLVLKLNQYPASKESQEHCPRLLIRMSALMICPNVVLSRLKNMAISYMRKNKHRSANESCDAEAKSSNSAEERKVIWFGPMAVSLDKRRCGIGTELLRFAEDRAKVLGYEMIKLSVDNCNEPAITLYEKIGFTRTSAAKDQLYYTKLLT